MSNIKNEAIEIYKYIKDNKPDGFNNIKALFLKHQDDILFISGDYDSYVNLLGDFCPKSDEIREEFISLLRDMDEIILKSGYGDYLINKHNSKIPNSTNDILNELFSFSSSNSFFKKYSSNNYLNKLSNPELTMMTSIYSNRMAKFMKACTINNLVSINNIPRELLTDKRLKDIFKDGSKMYTQYITKTDGNISIDDYQSPDKNALSIMKKNGIPKSKYKIFMYTLLLFQASDNLYSIKDNTVKDLALTINNEGGNLKSPIRMYLTEDTNTQTFSSNTYNQTYRIYSACKGFYAPLIQHIPKDMFDSFTKDRHISIDTVKENSNISAELMHIYPLNFKLDSSELKKLDEISHKYVDNFSSISTFKKRISPMPMDIKQENSANEYINEKNGERYTNTNISSRDDDIKAV